METLQERKNKILEPIFITSEQSLNIRLKNITDREKICKDIEIINKQLKSTTDNADMIIGELFREFELKNPCSQEIKDYLTNLWEFLSDNAVGRFGSSYEKYCIEEKIKTNSLKKYNDKIRLLNEKIKELKSSEEKQ